MQLDESQEHAVEGLLTHKIAIMTGGPGTGKTTTLKTALERMDGRVKLCAPTGKAAKRVTEVTGRKATTIHKLLFADGGEGVDTDKHIDADVIVIDEASMVDTQLLASLVRKLSPYTRLLLIGDAMQLPPVGAGQPFHDLLGVVPTFRLTKTHRQAGDSWVIDNARKIIAGEVPSLDNTHDFTFIETQDIEDEVVRMFVADPSITVLSPQNERGAGVMPLNKRIQAAVNPEFSRGRFDVFRSAFGGDYEFREGDRVLQTSNDNKRKIVNGDVGTITEIRGKKDLYVEFDCGSVRCVGDQVNDLKLAYALTVHKSQGSEYDHAVLVCDTAHSFMLRRQLVYTAITRAAKKLTLVGSKGALARACTTPLETNRRTALKERIL